MFPSTKYNELGASIRGPETYHWAQSMHSLCKAAVPSDSEKKCVSFLFFCVKTLVVVMETFTLAVMCWPSPREESFMTLGSQPLFQGHLCKSGTLHTNSVLLVHVAEVMLRDYLPHSEIFKCKIMFYFNQKVEKCQPFFMITEHTVTISLFAEKNDELMKTWWKTTHFFHTGHLIRTQLICNYSTDTWLDPA